MQPELRRAAAWFELIATVLSPLAVLAFLVLLIVIVDGFAQHVTFLAALDRYGVTATGTWRGLSSDGKMGTVELPHAEGDYAGVIIYAKHYRPASLAALREGQAVIVRYTGPPATPEERAVLVDYENEVRAYYGYLSDVFWPLLVVWAVLVVRPDVLFLGLLPAGEGSAPGGPSGPPDSRLPGLRRAPPLRRDQRGRQP